MLDLSVLAISLTQKVAGVGFAVEAGGRAVDEHCGHLFTPNSQTLQEKLINFSGYEVPVKSPATY